MSDGAPDTLRRLSDPRLHDRLGFKETTVRKLVKEGVLRAVLARGVLRVPDSAVDEFIANASRLPATADGRSGGKGAQRVGQGRGVAEHPGAVRR